MSHSDTPSRISGATAAEIAASARSAIERGELRPGDALPSVRALAEQLGVNRNTVVAAYRRLAGAGLAVGRGRAGTRVASLVSVAREGYAEVAGAVDAAAGNPDPALIPDPTTVLAGVVGRPVLYGAPVVDPGLEQWAAEQLAADLGVSADRMRITVTSGAADALDRLFTGLLAPGDAVAVEDPGFLTGIHTLRVGGYRGIPVPVDDEGMTRDGLERAIAAGARAIVCTPRAQNPTGASLSVRRASALRDLIADLPDVAVIEDDHFSLLSRAPYRSIIPAGHRRWALIRSVSKFLGPDMSIALVGSDPHTAERLGIRLRPGTAWVSHLLQRLALALLTDGDVRARIDAAADHYVARNAAFCRALATHGIRVVPSDGLNVWVPVTSPARDVAARLRALGWLVRPGDEFRVASEAAPSHHLRVTAHHLADDAMARLAAAIAEADA